MTQLSDLLKEPGDNTDITSNAVDENDLSVSEILNNENGMLDEEGQIRLLLARAEEYIDNSSLLSDPQVKLTFALGLGLMAIMLDTIRVDGNITPLHGFGAALFFSTLILSATVGSGVRYYLYRQNFQTLSQEIYSEENIQERSVKAFAESHGVTISEARLILEQPEESSNQVKQDLILEDHLHQDINFNQVES